MYYTILPAFDFLNCTYYFNQIFFGIHYFLRVLVLIYDITPEMFPFIDQTHILYWIIRPCLVMFRICIFILF